MIAAMLPSMRVDLGRGLLALGALAQCRDQLAADDYALGHTQGGGQEGYPGVASPIRMPNPG